MSSSGRHTPDRFAKLFADQRQNVRAQLARMLPASEVDDAMQEVFVKAAKSFHGFRGEAGAGTWLYRIAQRTAVDHLRSRRHHERQRTVPLARGGRDDASRAGCDCAADVPPVPAEAPGRVVVAEMHGCIREFVGRLSPEHAEVIMLKDLEGLTNPEIAAQLGISVDATKIRLHRARAAMRVLVDQGCELYRTTDNTLACDRRAQRRTR